MMNFKLQWLVVCAIILSATTDVAQSKSSYKSVLQRSVWQNKIVATWQRAMEKCMKQGAILASPIDAEVLKVMKSYIDVNSHTSAYFIGVKAKHNPELGSNDDDVHYVSIEGVDLDDMPDATLEMIDKIDPLEGDCLSDPDTSNVNIIKEFLVPRLILKGKDAELKCQVEEYGTDSSIVVKWFWIPRLATDNSMVLIYQRIAGQRPQAFQNSSPSKIKMLRGHKDTHDNILLKNIKGPSAGSYICQVSTLTGEEQKSDNLNVLSTE